MFSNSESPRCRSGRRPSLMHDNRGAILVPAVVMGALLVGALFYVAAAGDAIIFRTQLQDAADTSAFTAAIWHARGMNMIALLNVFMSLILFIVVLCHFIELLCFVVGFVPGIGAVATSVANAVMRFEQASSKFIAGGLKLFEATEQIVSAATPLIASEEAIRQDTRASSTLAGSLSLLPVAFDKRVVNRILPLEETRMPQLDVSPALPVQPDSFGGLCVHSASYLPELIVYAIDSLVSLVPLGPLGGFVSDRVNDAWKAVEPTFQGLAAAGNGVLCKPIDEMLASLGDVAADAVEQTCESKQQDEQAKLDGEDRAAGRPKRAAPSQSARKQATNKCAADIKEQSSKQERFDARPAMMWAAAGNGHAFTHTWSRASGTPGWFGRDAGGMSIAAQGSFPHVTQSNVAFAEAEFYFDCEGKWHECMGDATWSPSWTARMRRFRPPQTELMLVLQGPLLDPASVLKDSTVNIAQALGPQLLGGGNNKRELAGDALFGALINNLDKIPGLDGLMKRANGLAQQGLEQLGLTELFDAGGREDSSEMRRIH